MELWHLLVGIIYVTLVIYIIKDLKNAYENHMNGMKSDVTLLTGLMIVIHLVAFAIGAGILLLNLIKSTDFSWLHYKIV